MENGVIKFFNNKQDKLFGFIESAEGDVFFHLNNGLVPADGKKRLPKKGDRVSFERETSPKGPKAKSWFLQEEVVETKEPLPPVWTGKAGSNTLAYSKAYTVPNIQANLQRFGLEDLMVVGVVNVILSWKWYKVEIGPMLLSELCGRDVSREIELNRDLGRNYDTSSNKIEYTIKVYQNGQHIGSVDSDHRFGYFAAPDLRTCMGWAAATDAGHERELLFALDDKVERLKNILRNTPVKGSGEEVAKFKDGEYSRSLGQLWRNASRFSSVMSVFDLFFNIGTCELFGSTPSEGKILRLWG